MVSAENDTSSLESGPRLLPVGANRTGEVTASPIILELFPLAVDGPLEPWPEDLVDLKKQVLIESTSGTMESSLRSHVWLATLRTSQWRTGNQTTVVVKVLRLNVKPQHREPHDHLEQALRKTLKHRYGVRHRNIIDLFGIDSSFSPHAGLVLEYCPGGNLTTYCNQNVLDINTTARPSSSTANAYSLISDILEGLRYMHNYPVPIPQGDLTPDSILVGENGAAKISLFSFGRIISAIPSAANLTASVGPILPFRWMSPELLSDNSRPTTESDMWAAGCVCYWLLTGLRPYAGHLRDDFTGVDSVRGLPPGSISRIDYASTLGERVIVSRQSSWITNGIWTTVNKCWTLDPLMRPSANSFLRFLRDLEGRSEGWLPIDVADLAGKVKEVDPVANQIKMARYRTIWKQYDSGRKGFREHPVHMNVVRTTYTPNWYSKAIPVAVKQVFCYPASMKSIDPVPYVSSIRQEVAITAQLDHPSISKFLGIDSSHEKVPSMVFEYCSELHLKAWLESPRNNFQDAIKIIYELGSALAYLHDHPNGTIVHGNIQPLYIFLTSDGRAKLQNFTSAFQYTARSNKITPLSLVASTTWGESRWRCPEYYKEDYENHVPLPTVASDMWSFGCLILNVLTKQPPFHTLKATADAVAQLNAGIAPYSIAQRSELNNQVQSMSNQLIDFNPSNRPLMKDLLKNLSSLL
ncbi:kinase-like protein [Ceratobasidium sp. AG-I]|nr:kinase-like protein [Ceratobasidium sp. AG-I]